MTYTQSIRVIQWKDMWKDVPARWRFTYSRYPEGSQQHSITLKLEALSPEDLTGENIEAIIGNTSWTRFCCDVCGEEKETLCQIGDTPGYDQRYIDICEPCLHKAIVALGGASEINDLTKE